MMHRKGNDDLCTFMRAIAPALFPTTNAERRNAAGVIIYYEGADPDYQAQGEEVNGESRFRAAGQLRALGGFNGIGYARAWS